MAVATGDRQKTSEKLDAANSAKGLATYTIQICKNEKNFPKRDRWVITSHLVELAVDTYACLRKANRIAVKNMRDYELRREWQLKADANLDALQGLIEIAHMTLSLDQKRADYWIDKTVQCQNIVMAWRESDRKRFKGLMKTGNPNSGSNEEGGNSTER